MRVKAGEGLLRGQAWLPVRWGNRFMNSAGVNALTLAATDPYSHQPELKHAVVAIEKADLPWQLVVLRKGDAAANSPLSALALLERARTLLPQFSYATVGLYGRAEPLVIFRAALAEALCDDALREDALFGLDDEASAIVYADHRRQINKRAVAPDGKPLGVRLAGETLTQSGLKDVMADDTLDAALIRWAVAPIDKPPTKLPEKSRVVCRWADITENRINAELAQGSTFAGLQEKLKCGTFCGSCVPELKQMLDRRTPSELAA